MNYFNQEGHLNDEGISLYADGVKLKRLKELPEGLYQHVEDCSQCQQEIVDFSAILAEVDQSKSGAHPYFDRVVETSASNSNIRKLFYLASIAAALAALLFFGYKQLNQTSETPGIVKTPIEKEREKIVDPKETEKQKEVIVDNKKQNVPTNPPNNNKPNSNQNNKEPLQKNRELFAANYTPNEELETIVGSNFRAEVFKVSAPANEKIVKSVSEIVFAWENNIKLNFTILDNEETELYVKKEANSGLKIDKVLAPGLYYWKLESEEELFHLGKFIID